MSIEKISQSNKTIFKHNFIDLVRNYVPEMYIEEDINLSGVDNDPLYEILELIVSMIGDLSSIIYVNNHTSLNSLEFLFDVNSSFALLSPDEVFQLLKLPGDFNIGNYSANTVGQTLKVNNLDSIDAAIAMMPKPNFEDYLWGILDNFKLNSPSVSYVAELDSTITTTSQAHEYLLENYGWLYVLNTDEAFDSYSPQKTPRDFLLKDLILTTFSGNNYTIAHGVQAMLDYVWNSQQVLNSNE
jgi:hypothetical protein